MFRKEYALLGILMACISLFGLSNTVVGEQRNMVLLQGESTLVSGHISENTTWTFEGSPYIVVESIIVDTGVFLTIEPGVVVKFTAGTNLEIYGGLIAQGNATHKITFTSNATAPAPGDWAGIEIYSSAHYNITNSIIEYATIGITFLTMRAGIFMHSRVMSNIQGINVPGYAVLNGLTIEWNTEMGIYSGRGHLVIKDSLISNNYKLGIVGYGNSMGIYDSTISNNAGTGIAQGRGYGMTLKGSIVSNNGYGVYVEGSANIESTTIIENGYCGVNLPYGGGIHFSNLYNNSVCEVSGGTVDATYNWWGTTNETLISERISGAVSYVPFLNSTKATLTVFTSGVSSDEPVGVKRDGTGVGLVHDEKPLNMTLYSGHTQPNLGTFSLSIDNARIWDSDPNIRYEFVNWTGTIGSGTSNSITITVTANSSITAFYKTQSLTLISFSNSFKDSDGNDLYTLPSSFKLTFTNGTTSAPLNPNLSYYLQNETTTWSSIIWQGTEVCPSGVSFDPTDGNPTVNCKVYSLTVDPIFYDKTGTTLIQPSSWSIEFPNGTTRTVSSPVTYTQTQAGNYSIISIIWKRVEVIPDITPTTSLTSDKLWSPSINCILPTSLSISLSSSTSYFGFKVEINGNLTYNEVGLPGAPILLSYSVTGGETWNDIMLVNTASDGGYFAVWMPSATGNYLVRAVWSGDLTYPGATTIINLAVIPFGEENVFSVTSNSTISELAFNSTSRELSFTVTGPSGTTGYVNVYIAKTLVDNIADVKVYLDGDQLNYTTTSLNDSWRLHFTYLHSTHKVTISLGQISAPFIEAPLGKAIIYGIPIAAIIILVILYILKKKHTRTLSSAR